MTSHVCPKAQIFAYFGIKKLSICMRVIVNGANILDTALDTQVSASCRYCMTVVHVARKRRNM